MLDEYAFVGNERWCTVRLLKALLLVMGGFVLIMGVAGLLLMVGQSSIKASRWKRLILPPFVMECMQVGLRAVAGATAWK